MFGSSSHPPTFEPEKMKHKKTSVQIRIKARKNFVLLHGFYVFRDFNIFLTFFFKCTMVWRGLFLINIR